MDRPRPSDRCKSKCCWSPFGVCGTRGGCQHHKDAQWAIEMWDLEAAERDKHRHRSESSVRT